MGICRRRNSAMNRPLGNLDLFPPSRIWLGSPSCGSSLILSVHARCTVGGKGAWEAPGCPRRWEGASGNLPPQKSSAPPRPCKNFRPPGTKPGTLPAVAPQPKPETADHANITRAVQPSATHYVAQPTEVIIMNVKPFSPGDRYAPLARSKKAAI